MKKKPAAASSDPQEEIAALVLRLQETQQRLQELTGGGIDSVLAPGGQSILLQEAQEKLRQSELNQRQLAETLMTILNALPAHVALLDSRGVIIAVNDSWKRSGEATAAHGLDFSVNHNYVEICEGVQGPGANYAHESAHGVREVLRGATTNFTLEYPCHSPGQSRWLQLIAAPVRDGHQSGAVVMYVDVTARKVNEEQLMWKTALLEAQLNSTLDGVLLVDKDRNTLLQNQRLMDIWRVPPNLALERAPEERLEWVASQVKNPEKFTEGIHWLNQHPDEVGLEEIELRDGRVLDRYTAPIKDAQGNHFGRIWAFRDVTERRHAEQVLQSKTALLEAQLNSTIDGMLIADPDGRTLLLNQRVLDIWKIPREVAEGSDAAARVKCFSSQAKDPQAFEEKANWIYAHPDEISRDEIELIDGRFVDRYTAPIRGADGKHYGRIWVSRDITERKLAEKRATDQLELIEMAGRVGKLGAWAAEYPGPKVVWSEEMYRIREVEPGFQPDHESALSFFTPSSRRILEAAMEKKEPYDLELEIVTAKGNKRWVRTTSAVEMKNGEVSRIYGIFQDITDRKRTESRFRRLVDSNMQGVLFWAKGGAILEANDGFLQMVGYSQEDVKSGHLNWKTITPQEFDEGDLRALAEIADHGVCTPYEKEFIHKDGHRVSVLLGSAAFEDNPDEGICFVIDLTEQKRVESRFRRLVDSNAQGVMFWKTSGEITRGNDEFLKLVGYTREELTAGRINWQTITPPEYAEMDRDALQQIAATGRCESVEKEWIRKDGTRVPVYLSAASFEDSPNEGVTFILDLRDRHRAEARFRRLIDSNVQCVTFWNMEGEVIEANEAFLRLVGYTREDLKAGRINWRAMTPPEYAELDRKALEEIAASGICTTYEKEYIRKDGSRVPVLIGAAAFEDNPNEGVRFILDLTERKKLEHQFLRAQRMESIGTLAGGIAHDLNNILAPILMSIDILKLMNSDQQAKNILQTIELSAKRGADIVRQVLSFARGMEGERIEVQPKHLVKDIENIIKDTFPKNIRQELLIADDTWTILGDPTQLHQVLLNLCVNARDAMPNGGSLAIKVENCVLDEQYAAMNAEARPGRYVLISVTDSGTGIPPELLDKIFEPFFTTKEVGKGTGLGLSSTMGIVKSHDGVVNVYSEVGRGTTFNVYLPAMEGSFEGSKKQTQQIRMPRGNGETILVVDDEASILTITSQTLEAFGYRVLTAGDGAEAVALYAKEQNKIAVVLTDMTMPLMDGASTIRALLRINPAVKIIAASGLNAAGATAPAPEIGVRHFLTKPYTAGTLLKSIRTILEETGRTG
jgi:PAS domain S-box-containing protein